LTGSDPKIPRRFVADSRKSAGSKNCRNYHPLLIGRIKTSKPTVPQ